MAARHVFQMSLYSVLFHGSKAVLPNVLIQCIVSWQLGMYFQMSLYSVLFDGSKGVLPNTGRFSLSLRT